jgi:hypothetical protein
MISELTLLKLRKISYELLIRVYKAERYKMKFHTHFEIITITNYFRNFNFCLKDAKAQIDLNCLSDFSKNRPWIL